MDKYDREIEYLKNNPHHILFAWNEPFALFSYVTEMYEVGYGCLTQIRGGFASAPTRELNDEILNDSRIPKRPEQITVDDLEYFAEWQRRLDAMYPHRKTREFGFLVFEDEGDLQEIINNSVSPYISS